MSRVFNPAVTAAGAVKPGLCELWIIAALAAYLLARLGPVLDGLRAHGPAVLGAMSAGAVLWIT